MSADDQKRASAAAAVDLVSDGMTLGIGTGSTAAHFIDLLGVRVRDGLSIVGVPTSEGARKLALAAGIQIIEPDEATQIDLAVDGADEADGALNLIKGGGGALLREKIVARAARRFVVIADQSKAVAQLGAFPLPVEIAPALWGLTVQALRATLVDCGYAAPRLDLRPTSAGGAYLTDGGGYIVDCALERIADAAGLDQAIRSIPGVVETGLFVGMAHEAFFAGPDGVERRQG